MLSSYCNDCEYVVSLIGDGDGVRCNYVKYTRLFRSNAESTRLPYIIDINECNNKTMRQWDDD